MFIELQTKLLCVNFSIEETYLICLHWAKQELFMAISLARYVGMILIKIYQILFFLF